MITPGRRPVEARLDVARLDREVVRRGLARSRTQAQSMVTGGAVALNGIVTRRPAEPVHDGDVIEAVPEPYVSRAAHKLSGALVDLDLRVTGRALDAGAAHGGFTQVLLERGCSEVIAVDVGWGQLADRLREEPRVVVWEHTNLRDLRLAHVGGRPVDLVVADVSFISLTLLVGALASVLKSDGAMLLMVKPQFEVGREHLGRGGVVREPERRRAAVRRVLEAAGAHGWFAERAVPSRALGSAGNQEYFVLLRNTPGGTVDVGQLVAD